MVNLLSGIVRIEINKRIGTGFVVSKDGLILTCAHVLGQFMPEKASVVLQSSGEEREAMVLAEGWRSVDAEDVALLRVSEGLPPGVQPLPLGSSQGTEGHSLITFGYPESGEVEGVRGTGLILGRGARTKGGQLLLQLRSSEITEGFSGAPIWDEQRQRVIGMVVIAAEMDPLGKLGETAFATPTETLQAIVPALQVSDICPYRNLEVFTEDDAPFFFGRQSIIDELVYSLHNERRFLAVFGPSGCGKSSLVQAGLIPRLRAGEDIPGSDRWKIIVARQMDDSLALLLKGLGNSSPPTAVILDQFEELFATSSETVRTQIVAQMTRLLESAPDIMLIVVMRNDFYPRFVQQETLERWVKRSYNVPLLIRRAELVSIVEEPAKFVGVQFEEGLIERIVNDALDTTYKHNKDAGSSTVLPLLEFALTQLWELRRDGILTHKAYEKIGRVTGALTQRADHEFYSFEEKQRPLVQRLFTDLVHLGDKEQSIPDTRRRQELSSLVHMEAEQAEVSQIVKRLVDARLLVVSQETESKKETVEIIHDALLGEWGKLQQWVEDNRNFLLWRQELERLVRAWETSRADPAKRGRFKLLAGSDLTEAIQWLNTRSSDLRPSEREFIQASRKGISRRRFFRWSLAAGLVVLGAPTIYFLGELIQPRAKVSPFKLPYTYPGHRDVVSSVAWSPDGKRLASGSWDGTVQVWDASTGTTLVTYMGHTRGVNSVAWSHDGKHIASASSDKTVRVWDASSGTTPTLVTYMGHAYSVGRVAWSPDGKRLASVSIDGMIRLWDATTGNTFLTYHYQGAGDTVAWSPDGARIASGDTDGTVQVRDANTGDILLTYTSAGGAVYSVAWSPDSKRIASGGYDGPVQVWDGSTGDTLLTYTGHTDEVFDVTWSADGKRIASGGADKSVQVWDADTGCLHLTYTRHTAAVESVAWSPDGKRIASASADKTVQVWSSDNRSTVLTYTGHTAAVNDVAWLPGGGQLLASASRDKTAQVWDANTGCSLLIYKGHTEQVFGVAWSPDGRRIASASFDKTVQVWDANTGDIHVTYKGHTHAVGRVEWSPDGKRIGSSGGGDKTVKIWDANSGNTLLTCKGHTSTVYDVAWSPDGKRIASASWDRTVRVWDANSGNTLFTYIGHTDKMYSVAWSPDGRRVASASRDQTVQVWDASSGNTLFTYMGHNNAVLDVAWSPDGKYLASASADTTVQVWEANTGHILLSYKGHTNFVSSVAWSPNGARIASTSLDRTVQVWPLK